MPVSTVPIDRAEGNYLHRGCQYPARVGDLANYEKNKVKFHSSLYFSDFPQRHVLRGQLHARSPNFIGKLRSTGTLRELQLPECPWDIPAFPRRHAGVMPVMPIRDSFLVSRGGFEPPLHLVANQGCVLPLNYRNMPGNQPSATSRPRWQFPPDGVYLFPCTSFCRCRIYQANAACSAHSSHDGSRPLPGHSRAIPGVHPPLF